MLNKYRMMVAPIALALCSPAIGQGYEPTSGKTLDQQIAEKCKGKKGQQRTACETRIRDSYQRHLERIGGRRN